MNFLRDEIVNRVALNGASLSGWSDICDSFDSTCLLCCLDRFKLVRQSLLQVASLYQGLLAAKSLSP